jgi:hypothetical protein
VNRPTDILKREYHTDHDQRLSGYLEAIRMYELPFDKQFLLQPSRDWDQQSLDDVIEQAVDQILQMGDHVLMDRPRGLYAWVARFTQKFWYAKW